MISQHLICLFQLPKRRTLVHAVITFFEIFYKKLYFFISLSCCCATYSLGDMPYFLRKHLPK
ncbi:Uncharacterised protein [Segatella copri]|nr:Uncharacterised protein [Segatella copri]